ncbi:hypothetical protein D9M68_598310 [compost metagenome]
MQCHFNEGLSSFAARVTIETATRGLHQAQCRQRRNRSHTHRLRHIKAGPAGIGEAEISHRAAGQLGPSPDTAIHSAAFTPNRQPAGQRLNPIGHSNLRYPQPLGLSPLGHQYSECGQEELLAKPHASETRYGKFIEKPRTSSQAERTSAPAAFHGARPQDSPLKCHLFYPWP